MIRAVATHALLLSAAAFAQDAGTVHRPIRWEVPEVIEETVVPQRLYAVDYPVTVHAVKSRLKPKALVEFFFKEFDRAGLFVPPEDRMPRPLTNLSITGLDTEHLISYTVIFQADADSTTAIMTETYMAERRKQPESAFAATFPGATDVVRSGSEGIATITYTAPAKPDEVIHFHRDVLTRQGFKETEPGVFERPNERLELSVRAGKKEGTAIVTVLQRPGG